MLNGKVNIVFRRLAAGLLILTAGSIPAAAAPAGIKGHLFGTDGRPAERFQVVLISSAGDEIASSSLDPEGAYRFQQVQPGEYGLGVRGPEGQAAAVLMAPVQVDDETVTRNIRLRSTTSPVTVAPAGGGVGVWWAGLSPAAKVWTVTGGLVVAGLVFSAADEDDSPREGEEPATPSLPF